MPEDLKVHIYPSDCDSVGHVNHAHMLVLLERARWSALERHMSYDAYMKSNLWAVVRNQRDAVVCDASIVYVTVSPDGKPIPVPDQWRTLFSPWEEEASPASPRR